MKAIFSAILAAVLIAMMIYSGWRVWEINAGYESEALLHEEILAYKPAEASENVNQIVIDLQQKYPDITGWLSIPNTGIDYPFVWYEDNDYYLRRDLDGNRATSGTLFLDFRCEQDFTSQNTIIYGHHMKNGSMFGTLKSFADNAFFDVNRGGTIYLPRETLRLEFFAYMVVKSNDAEIYSTVRSENYLNYVSQNARQYREIELAESDRIITLSTCSYEFDNARTVLLAKISLRG